jgi:FKBP-type peptidyl-prolyl cis-trans isomerase SlyD
LLLLCSDGVFLVKIARNKVVIIDYSLKNDEGLLLDQSDAGEFVYLHGLKNIIPGLENALEGKGVGDSIAVRIPPEQGYGVRDEEKIAVVTRDMFPEDANLDVGAQFHAQGEDGEMTVISVTEVNGDSVTVDGNHPLAGIHLNFDVRVIAVRDATADELSHGHVHEPGGHHH